MDILVGIARFILRFIFGVGMVMALVFAFYHLARGETGASLVMGFTAFVDYLFYRAVTTCPRCDDEHGQGGAGSASTPMLRA